MTSADDEAASFSNVSVRLVSIPSLQCARHTIWLHISSDANDLLPSPSRFAALENPLRPGCVVAGRLRVVGHRTGDEKQLPWAEISSDLMRDLRTQNYSDEVLNVRMLQRIAEASTVCVSLVEEPTDQPLNYEGLSLAIAGLLHGVCLQVIEKTSAGCNFYPSITLPGFQLRLRDVEATTKFALVGRATRLRVVDETKREATATNPMEIKAAGDLQRWSVFLDFMERVRAVRNSPHRAKDAFLIVGPSGSGKSTLLRTVRRYAHEHPEERLLCVTDPCRLERSVTSSDHLYLLLLDEGETLFSKRQHRDRKDQLMVLRSMRRLLGTSTRLLVCLAVSNPGILTPDVTAPGLLDGATFRIHPPTDMEREELFRRSLPPGLVERSAWASAATVGFDRAQLMSICGLVHHSRGGDISPEELERIVVQALPASLSNETWLSPTSLMLEEPEDPANATVFAPRRVGGLSAPRTVLWEHVLAYFRGETRDGIVIFGDSGQGKTMLALALGRHVRRTGLGHFLCVRCGELVSKVVGETEANVRRLFRQARDCAPCLLFFDGIESLAFNRDEAEDTTEGTFNRVLSMMLVELDGVNQSESVLVVGATASLKSLDAALIRPGRLGLHVRLDGLDSRTEILEVLRAAAVDVPLRCELTEVADSWTNQTATRADLANWVRRAALIALRNEREWVVLEDFLQARSLE